MLTGVTPLKPLAKPQGGHKRPSQMNNDHPIKEIKPRFGLLLVVCFAAVIFCGILVWFASTYLLDCCGP